MKINKYEKAMFGAGCFWGVQYHFNKIPGVIKTETGYSGGKTKNPSYEEVCSDKTSHAEVVHILFDSRKVSYEKLLEIFWRIHDPTTPNMQWPDVGSQYRSAIFYFNDKQKIIAMNSKKEIQKIIKRKVVTEIKKAKTFYRAEDYHQDYIKEHGFNSCHIASNPWL